MAKHGNTKYCYKGKILTINDLITKDTLELTINERIILFIRNLVKNIKKQLCDYKNTLLVDLNIDNQSVRKIIKLE